MRLIQGAGGGGGGGKGNTGGGGSTNSAPVEAADSLRSQQKARLVDALCEGEIKGLVKSGLKSVFLDGVPVENNDGTFNFKGVTLSTRLGTQAQTFLPGFPSVEIETPVATALLANIGITRTITDTNVDAVRITVQVPSLLKQSTTTGDITGTNVRFQIHVNNNGGGFVLLKDDTISGKTSGPYQRSWRIELPSPGSWVIRVTRITADSASAALQNDLSWSSYTAITDSKFRYPNTVLAAWEILANQFSRLPVRGYEVDLLLVQIPDIYNPTTRAYSGVWSGTFVTAWTDNPAWCYYDILVNNRYGLGEFVDATQIDKFGLLTIAKYCDELVEDGFGGMEPRFTCNLFLQTRAEAFSVVNAISSIFRAISYWSAGSIIASQDAPADATALFTDANVVDGLFTYSGSALRGRHTVALVAWNDPKNGYKRAIEYVPDNLGIALYGVRETEVVAIGCTSRGQAHRVGRHILYSERLETETVSFGSGLDSTAIVPGVIFKTIDASRAGARNGGRVVSATITQVIVDSAVTISAGETYTLNVILPDGTLATGVLSNPPGSHTALDLITTLPAVPQAQSMWVLSATNLAPETWRCIAVTENDVGEIEITGLQHDVNKYLAIEKDIILESAPTSVLSLVPTAPTNLVVSEELYQAGPALVNNRITFAWTPVLSAMEYRVVYFREQDNPVTVITDLSFVTVDNALAGAWTFTVIAINALSTPGPASQITQTIIGASALPTAPQNLTIGALGQTAVLRWDATTDLDVAIGGKFEIRHAPVLSGALWSSSTSIGDAVPGSATGVNLPLLTGTYLAKAKDAGGRYSSGTSLVTTKGASILTFAAVSTIAEHPIFGGTHTDTTVFSNTLKLVAATSIDAWGNLDSVALWDAEGGTVQTGGTYDFLSGFDGVTVANYRVRKTLVANVVDETDLIDLRTANMDTWLDFDGVLGNEADATVWIRETDDDPAAAPTWSAWNLLDNAEYNARAFDFQARLTTTGTQYNINVTSLGAVIDKVA